MHRSAALLVAVSLAVCADAADQPLRPDEIAVADLSAAANMGFVDDKAGDGVGGWSDQGPDNSFESFPVARTSFAGVPFSVLDPAKNGGKAIISFRHQSLPAGPTRAELKLPAGTRGRWLYLLHSSCWGGLPAGTVVGTATVGGRPVEIQAGRDIADWWGPKDQANAVVAVRAGNASASVGAYVSRFDLGDQVQADSVVLESSGRALWIVIGATLSRRDIAPVTETQARKPSTVVADAEWKVIDTGDMLVKPGTALDFSAWNGDEPAGAHGRVIARPDGHLAFAGAPETTVRFHGAVVMPELQIARLKPEDMAGVAEAIRRQGYNIVRPHFLDNMLTPEGVPAGQWFHPDRLAVWDSLVFELKKRGIYIYLDAMTHWSGYTAGNAWTPEAKAMDFKKRIWGDQAVRTHWKESVAALLAHRNPLTGTTLAEDPQLAVVLPFNEQEHNLFAWGIPDSILPGWRVFLRQRYGTIAALAQAWQREVKADSFESLPLFTTADIWNKGALGHDIAEYLADGERELVQWFTSELRAMGYQGLITHFDYLSSRRYALARAGVDAVSMHGYHAHPSSYKEPGSKVSQASQLGDAANWWRGIQSVRHAGKPFLVTEYQTAYWNRYRHEEGAVAGAYASLQDIDGMFQFSWQVMTQGRAIWPFYVGADPVCRASAVVTGLMWAGRRIAPAQHRVDLLLSRRDVMDRPESGVDGDQSRLGLLTGLAMAVEGSTSGTPATLSIPLGEGARVQADKMFVSTVDATTGGLAGLVGQLREKGILPAGNRSDPAKGLFESETGQILLDARNQTIAVRGAGIASTTVKPPALPAPVDGLRVLAASTAAAVTVADLGGTDCAIGRRLLLVVATDARNSNELYDDQEQTTLRKVGDLPILYRTGTFAIAIRRAAGAPALTAWSLALDGTRRDRIATTQVDGELRLDLDTAALPGGPTPFIELAAE